MAQRKCKLLCKMATLTLLVTAVLCCNLLLSEKDVYTVRAEVDENGFDIQDGVLVKYSGDATEVVIPEGVTAIGDEAFAYCDSLTSITIPEGVQTIGDEAFLDCDSLTSITISEGVQTIGDGAFCWCDSLTSITIPEGVQTIGNGAFLYCDSLTSITISEGVQTIGRRAFSHCYSLTSITIPEGVQTIGDEAFLDCYSLTSITIEEGVRTIGYYAFLYCYSLTSITIPKSVQTIEKAAFYPVPEEAIFYVIKDSYAESYVIELGYTYEYYTGSELEESIQPPLAEGISIISSWKNTNTINDISSCVNGAEVELAIGIGGIAEKEAFTVEVYDANSTLLETLSLSDFDMVENLVTGDYRADAQRAYSFSEAGKRQLILKYIAEDGAVCFKSTPMLYVQRPDIATQEQLDRLASYAGTNINEFLIGNEYLTKLDNGLTVDGVIYNQYNYNPDGEGHGGVTFFVKAVQKGNPEATLVTDYTILQKLLFISDFRERMIYYNRERINSIVEGREVVLRGLNALKGGEIASGLVGAGASGYLSGGASFKQALGKMALDKITDPDQYMTALVTAKLIEIYDFYSQLGADIENELDNQKATGLSDYDTVLDYSITMNAIVENFGITFETLEVVAEFPNSENIFLGWLELSTKYFLNALDTMTLGLGGKLTSSIKDVIGTAESATEILSCATNVYDIVNWDGDNPVEGLDTADKISDVIVKIGSNLKGGDAVKNIKFAGMDATKWVRCAKKVTKFLDWAIAIHMTESEIVDYRQLTDTNLIRTLDTYNILTSAAKDYVPLKGECLSEIPEMIEMGKAYTLNFEISGNLEEIRYNQPGMEITEKIETRNGKTYVTLTFVCNSLVARNLEFKFYNGKDSYYEWSKWIYSYKQTEEEAAEKVILKVQTSYTGTKYADVRKPVKLETAKPGYYEVIRGMGGVDELYPAVKGGNTCYIYNLDNRAEGSDTIHDSEGNDIFYIISKDADFNKLKVGHSHGDLVIRYEGLIVARFVNKTTNASNSSTLTVKLARSVEQLTNGNEVSCGFEDVAGVELKLPKIIYSAHCPIDLYVFDPDGNIAQILPDGQESEVYTDYGVFVVEYDAEQDEYLKNAYLYDDTYTVKFIGNDEGTMEYSVVKSAEDGSAEVYEQKEIPVSKNVVLSVDAEDFSGLTDSFGNVTTVNKVEEAENIEITSGIFPDTVFKEFVVTNFDTDGDDALSFEEADAVTAIDVSGLAISSLKGIECFTELETLKLSGCMVTSLDLSMNTKLVTLDVSGNRLTYLDLYNNPLLTTLESTGNKTTIFVNDAYSLSGLPGLDASKVISWTGASYDAATDSLTGITGDVVTYIYDCGNGKTVEFTLVVQRDPIEAFVTRMYRIILEREPDAGSSTWVNGLKDGSMTGVRVADGFVLSEEMLNKDISNEEFVKILYRAFFGREADADGLATWKGLLDAGCKKTYVFAGFANSTEFGTLCAEAGIVQGRAAEYLADRQTGLSEADYKVWCFVERMYMEVLNRTADEPGVRSWVGALQNGSMTGVQVADGFIMSDEFLAKEMSNEAYVRIMYRAFFGRDADAEGLATWTNALATGWTKQEVFAGFANSNEFGVLCEQAGIVKGTAEGK